MEYQRPREGFRFIWGGVNTRDVPDALPPNKYVAGQNVRSTGAFSVRTRPGYVPLFSTGNNAFTGAITDIRAYSALETDALPRILARDDTARIWLDTGALVGAMADSGNQYGASMLPFRPPESPQTWMYIGCKDDYQKFSAPSNTNAVLMQRVGIAEPQQELEACPELSYFTNFTGNNSNWAASGNAGALTNGNRSSDTSGAVIPDPVLNTRQYIQVGNNNNAVYQIGELVAFNNNTVVEVADVFPAVGGNLTVEAIQYSAGNNGSCLIVPSQMPFGSDERIEALAALRRGSLLMLSANNSTETVLVREIITGPNGALAFTTNTNNTWTANAAITGLPSIAVDSNTALGSAQSITSVMISSNITASGPGLGYISQNFAVNPFAVVLGNSTFFPQQDDYVHMSFLVSDPTQLTQVLIIFGLDSNNFNDNVLYYTVRQSDFVDILTVNTTVLNAIQQAAENAIISQLAPPGQGVPVQGQTGNNQWREVTFPISALTRLGDDQLLTLANCTGVQIQTNANNNITVSFGSLWVGGGSSPDVGNNGAPYRYQAVPLSSLTGVRGNPTALTRYGVYPRRQPVLVKSSNLNSSYDPQIDTWEIFRYGGSITSYRFLGTTPIGSDFVDTYFDDAAAGGDAIQIDNTEPWPSIDQPWKVTSGNATITATGNHLYVTVAGNNFPATITRWLPGTLFQVGGAEAFTLRYRPTSVGNNTFLFQFEEAIGFGNQTQVFVIEPNVARQTLPYLWGPNEEGYFFGVGDPLRPGTVSWSKPNNPDAAPTPNTSDLCPPSEPLLSGAITHGVSLVASSKRWWYLYYQGAGGGGGYSKVEAGVGKRLAAPWGICSDGSLVYFWASDGICATDGGGAKSLTDPDLYNLFPHGGLSGVNVTRAGVTYYAPDYSQAAGFRLAVREGILYATYRDTTGTFRVLICELSSGAWSQDSYHDEMEVFYALEQPQGSLETAPQLYPAVIVGDVNGKVWKLKDYASDDGSPINGLVGTFEYNGGDLRVNELFGDQFIDCVAPYGLSVQPFSGGNAIPGVPPTVLGANTSRVQVPVSMNGGQLVDYAGLVISWTDFPRNSTLAIHTRLYGWQPSLSDQVEITTDRASDWTNAGGIGNKFFQGIILDADTFGSNKNLVIQDADTGANHALQPVAVNHNGRQTIPYSFATPFLAHSVRDVPGDMVPWRKFAIQYVFEPTPESVETWETQWSAFGMEGYKSVPRIEASYACTADVSLSLVSYDGTSPVTLTLPATAGVTERDLLTLTFNKGSLYKFTATSDAPFQLFLNDFIVYVAPWSRTGPMIQYRNLGGSFGDKASI